MAGFENLYIGINETWASRTLPKLQTLTWTFNHVFANKLGRYPTRVRQLTDTVVLGAHTR